MSALWQQFVTEGNQLRASFESELRTTHVEQAFALLKGSQTPTRAALLLAGAQVASAEQKYSQFGPRYEQMLRSFCDRVMEVDARDGRDCQAGLVDSHVTRRFELQRRYYSEWRALLQFLASRTGSYSLTAQGFQFQAKADSTTFNRLLNTVAATEDEARSLEQQGNQALQRLQAQFGAR